jgi:hypothetical protein
MGWMDNGYVVVGVGYGRIPGGIYLLGECIRLLAFRREIDMGYAMARRCCGSMLSVFALPQVLLRVTFAVEGGVKRTRVQ